MPVLERSAEAPLLKTERADVSDTVTTKAMQELPALGRDMSRMYFMVPGVQATGTTAWRSAETVPDLHLASSIAGLPSAAEMKS